MLKQKKGVPSLNEHLVSIIITVCLCSCLASCRGVFPLVHFVLPDGYTGVFKIVLDEANGIDVRLTDGRYTYEIPAGGILRVKSFKHFEQWHEATAAYRNGTQIPTLSTVNSDTVALRSLGIYTRGDGPPTMTFVIGTKEEEDKFRTQMDNADFDNLPPNPAASH